MRGRLARLGVEGVEARTFHSAALAQLTRSRGERPGRILSTKALLLRQIGNSLPRPYRFRPAGDLATEVEWAKNRRLTPEGYRAGLGGGEDVCAVGDDYQSIYGFTGASPEWLLGLATRFPRATVVRLEENYRSSPQVLALANRLTPKLGGAEKTLRATRAEGPEPVVRGFDSPGREGAFVLERVRALGGEGVRYGEMGVLNRLNSRSADF